VLAVALGAGCSLPYDPNGTLDDVRGDTLSVGVSEAPPWVARHGEAPGGVEADLVRRFADDLGAEVEWIWGGPEEHLEALERFQLDLVIGGLTRASPWRKRVAFTAPYFTDTLRIGIPPGAPVPRTLEGLRVAVAPGSVLAATLEERGAVPVPTRDLAAADGPVAASAWELARWGFAATSIELGHVRHVLAVPPGENGWLVRLERFLRRHADEVASALRTDAPR
jgi:polar amino acid transport system substrate-binding protein